jgi:hypothetical protein
VTETKAGNFAACISRHGTIHYLGTFETAEEAGRAYDTKAREFYGPRCFTNY